MDMKQWAFNMLEKNPNIANAPMAKEMIEVLKSGDNSRGEQMANNILQTYGITKDDAISQAKKFFGM